MKGRWIILGCVAVLVGLGFVFPQIAQLRIQGSVPLVGLLLLLLGLTGVGGGLWCLVRGVKGPSAGTH